MKKAPPKVPTSMSVDRAKKKSSHRHVTGFLEVFGRDGVIRTLDPLHPIKVKYDLRESKQIQQ